MSVSKAVLAAVACALVASAAAATTAFPTATRAGAPPASAEDAALQSAVASDSRSAAHKARDAYRRPYESLTFWGLRPGMTVIEIQPGGEAWWTEILAPYAKATGGTYLAGYNDLTSPNMSDRGRKARADFEAKFGVTAVNFGTGSGLGVPDDSADLILVARAFHNWAGQEGVTDRFMGEFARALKPGGVLAVEQHRAAEGRPVLETAEQGYVPESYVIEAAKKAGLVLDARSEINANPKDTKDHPFGVWTLPPIKQTAPRGQPANPGFDRSRYDAIGESDRMTLRFRKPG
ncbi:MAG TPA: methyltransferase domain-containing protein [Caulobacteraceae bacterium]|nr:methyltransferase domain-containing protein [Caulobacteraceae bacterium]